MTIATNQIRAKRERRGLSLAELSDMTGIVEPTLQGLEDGVCQYEQTQLEAIAAAMDCHPAALLERPAMPFSAAMADWQDCHAAMVKIRDENPGWLDGSAEALSKVADLEDAARFDALATPAQNVAELLHKARLYLDSTNPDDGDHPRHREAMEALRSDLNNIWPGYLMAGTWGGPYEKAA